MLQTNNKGYIQLKPVKKPTKDSTHMDKSSESTQNYLQYKLDSMRFI